MGRAALSLPEAPTTVAGFGSPRLGPSQLQAVDRLQATPVSFPRGLGQDPREDEPVWPRWGLGCLPEQLREGSEWKHVGEFPALPPSRHRPQTQLPWSPRG